MAWISDTHVGDENWGAGENAALVEEIETHRPQLGIHTGDMTHSGVQEETAEYLSTYGVLVNYSMQGNHDSSSAGWLLRFTHKITGYKLIGFFATTIPETTNGRVSESEIEWLENELQNVGAFRPIVCCHFPVLDDFGVGSIQPDYGQAEVLALLSTYNVPVYLSGHLHNNCDYVMRDLTTHISGAAAVYTLPSRPGGFHIIDFYSNRLSVSLYRSHAPFEFVKCVNVPI